MGLDKYRYDGTLVQSNAMLSRHGSVIKLGADPVIEVSLDRGIVTVVGGQCHTKAGWMVAGDGGGED